MLDAGHFTPSAALAPTRGIDGTTLGRITTTDEQRQEAIEWMVQQATEHKELVEVSAVIDWPNAEPTTLRMALLVEHIDTRRVWVVDKITEFTAKGVEVVITEPARLQQLTAELVDMHDRDMI